MIHLSEEALVELSHTTMYGETLQIWGRLDHANETYQLEDAETRSLFSM
jgi:hypothetical protein